MGVEEDVVFEMKGALNIFEIVGWETSCPPSPRPSPSGRGGIVIQFLAMMKRVALFERGQFEGGGMTVSLSPRERAGVRGNARSNLRDLQTV
jgi:hypothetical protein